MCILGHVSTKGFVHFGGHVALRYYNEPSRGK